MTDVSTALAAVIFRVEKKDRLKKRGSSEIISRILWPYNIRVAHRPITTLRNLLTNVKDKEHSRDRQAAIHKIKCTDCQATYIGETGRDFNTRLTEQNRNYELRIEKDKAKLQNNQSGKTTNSSSSHTETISTSKAPHQLKNGDTNQVETGSRQHEDKSSTLDYKCDFNNAVRKKDPVSEVRKSACKYLGVCISQLMNEISHWSLVEVSQPNLHFFDWFSFVFAGLNF